MDEISLKLFGKKDVPDKQIAWKLYDRGQGYNSQINLDATVQSNENFYIGK